MIQKLIEVLKSRNFAISIISFFAAILGYQNIPVNFQPEEIYNLFSDKSFTEVIVVLFANFFGIFSKLISKILDKSFDWSFIKDSNVITLFISIISIVISALLGNVIGGLLITIVITLLNTVYHLSLPLKQEQKP